jgi:hypothetical protein
MDTSTALGIALESLAKCIHNLTFYPTHAPSPDALSEEWAAAERHNVTDRALHAANLAVQLDDQRAAAEGRIQVIKPALAGEIGDARERALSLITILFRQKDLATTYYAQWPAIYQRDVDDLRALNERLRCEARRLMSETAPAVEPAPVDCRNQSAPNDAITYADDFGWLRCHLGEFVFTNTQRPVVQALVADWQKRGLGLSSSHLLEVCGTVSERLRDVFKGNPAWGTLIVETRKGYYMLAKSLSAAR